MSATIRCNLCPSVIFDESFAEALRLSREHLAKAHPAAHPESLEKA